ncbi:cAMP-dependent protein kinase regulatory subunit, partial [Reticulomyxa filosa]
MSRKRNTLTNTKPPLLERNGSATNPTSPNKRFSDLVKEGLDKPVDFLKNALRTNQLFSSVDDEHREKMLDKLVHLMKPVQLQPGEVLITQGETGDAFYVIEKGKFDIFVKEADSLEIQVGEAGPQAAVGEYALLYHTPRTATLKATEPSVVWGLEAADFHDIRQKMAQWNVERFVQRGKFLKKLPIFGW